jgi:hypothetical protein
MLFSTPATRLGMKTFPNGAYQRLIREAFMSITIEELPFVKDYQRPAKKRGFCKRSFWHVCPTGDWGKDCQIGRMYGELAHSYMKSKNCFPLLAWVVRDMKSESGIEIGFLGYFARLSTSPKQ